MLKLLRIPPLVRGCSNKLRNAVEELFLYYARAIGLGHTGITEVCEREEKFIYVVRLCNIVNHPMLAHW